MKLINQQQQKPGAPYDRFLKRFTEGGVQEGETDSKHFKTG